jgi:hypothetical protein
MNTRGHQGILFLFFLICLCSFVLGREICGLDLSCRTSTPLKLVAVIHVAHSHPSPPTPRMKASSMVTWAHAFS